VPDYYGDTFFKSAGTTLSPYVIQTILGGVSVAGTAPALIFIETIGRRKVGLHAAHARTHVPDHFRSRC
jgi:hypothetical protein